MKVKKIIFGVLVSMFSLFPMKGMAEATEVVALKNNLVYDAALTPNLEVEVKLAKRWSLEIGAGFNPFPLDDKKFPKWRHVSAWIAPRYWFCNVFHRDFISFNAAYTHYNVAGAAWPVSWMYKQVKDSRYQGDAVMAGISYGWHFAISPHFSVELEGGVDAGYSWYDQFECKHCGNKTARGGRWFVLPKFGVNLSVPLGGNEESMARRCGCELLDNRPVYEEIAPLDTTIVFEDIAPLEPIVPLFEVQAEAMHRLRSRLLRNEESYEPYHPDQALSADPRNVFMFFEVNAEKMDRDYLANNMQMDSIMRILGEALEDSTMRITKVRIVGFASFDGKRAYNDRLAASRAVSLKEYIQSIYPLRDDQFDLCNGGESWAELRYRLSNVEFEGRDEVLTIINTVRDADLREKLIKQLHGGKTYRYMRDELKEQLRNLGCITIYYCENLE